MITGPETNTLYLSDLLPLKQPAFFSRFEKVLADNNIIFKFLPGTKDIWAVDYMPVQITRDCFIQVVYNPDYLQSAYYQKTISDVDSICKELGIRTHKSDLVVDGGNIVRTKDKVIMCDKVFIENGHLSPKEITKQLRRLFEVDHLFFIPWNRSDFCGHADGMVRFIDADTVLINDYSKEEKDFQASFKKALDATSLNCIELPYNPPTNPKSISARGLYLNYLHMQQAVIVPVYKTKIDEKALAVLEDVFKGQTIVPVESNELAARGGVLNCISWNIMQ